MTTDPSWLYSTIAQSSATIVAIVGGFITASVMNLWAEKRSLINQKEDKTKHIQNLSNLKLKIKNEYQLLEVQNFTNSILGKLISENKLPSIEEITKNHHEAENLDPTILRNEYETLCIQITKAKEFISNHINEIVAHWTATFEEWLKINNLSITSVKYEILNRVYDELRLKIGNERRNERQSSSIFPNEFSSINQDLFNMKLPYTTPLFDLREMENLGRKLKENEYEIFALEKDVEDLNNRINAFSYPPNLKVGAYILGFLSVFGIIAPITIILNEAFFIWAKWLVTGPFWIGIIGVFAYIVYQISSLRRK